MKPQLILPLLLLISFNQKTMGQECKPLSATKARYLGVHKGTNRAEKFLSDATVGKNRTLSKNEKIRRVKETVIWSDETLTSKDFGPNVERRNSLKDNGNTIPEGIARKIVWAAGCTGNDFSMLAGIIGHESGFCIFPENLAGGGDSGCGQFTTPAFNEIRHAFDLDGSIENGILQKTANKMLNACTGSSFVNAEKFREYFSRPIDEIRTDMRSQKNISMEILATGIFLKLLYATVTDGMNDGVEMYRKAFKAYNSNPNIKDYGGKVLGTVAKVERVEYQLNCEEQYDDLRSLERFLIEMSEEKSLHYLSVESFEI